MNILIIGNGGREHAFAWKISQSPACSKLYVAPGNAGTSTVAENIAIAADDFAALGEFCVSKHVELVLVGPEAPLVKGIRDYFQASPALKHILMVGPDKLGAQLEGSKDFSKKFMLRHKIPTAKAKTFTVDQLPLAFEYVQECKPPIVLKADGLAAGKGVVISLSQAEAKAVLEDMLLNKRFGEASAKVLIEEFLNGIELSVFVLTDGKDYVILPEAKDYKRIGDGDTGPNTGGMGAVSPVVFANSSFMKKVEDLVVKRTIKGLQEEEIDYRGFIFVGLMNVGGEPYVIEYNARMGDPETQAVMTRVKSDFVDLLVSTAKGELRGKSLEVDPATAVTVVMVSEGYPGDYEKGRPIDGLTVPHSAMVFHAGTKTTSKGVVSDGGRVLAITGKGPSIEKAKAAAYHSVAKISWDGYYFRKDIADDLINYK
jgi:phosphoribosylamine---glycine ligase